MHKLSGIWDGWEITDDALVSPTGRTYTPSDIEPEHYTQAELARALGVTRGAIADRIRRGTLPPYDDPEQKTWRSETIRHLFHSS